MGQEKARKCAIWLLRIESSILALMFLYLIFGSLTSEVTTWSALIGEMIFALGGAIGLYFASTSYVKGKSFGRSPAVLANLIALGVSYFMISGHFYSIGIPLAILGATTVYCAIAGYREI